MADLIYNLLQRSDVITMNQDTPVILQPRLPSLYEPTPNQKQLGTWSTDERINDGAETDHLSAPTNPPVLDHQNLPVSSTILPRPPVSAFFHQQNDPILARNDPGSTPPAPVYDRQVVPGQDRSQQDIKETGSHDPSPSTAKTTRQAKSQQKADHLIEKKIPVNVEPPASPIVSTFSQQEKTKMLKRKPFVITEEHAIMSPLQEDGAESTFVDHSPENRIIRPRVESIRSFPEPAQILNQTVFTPSPRHIGLQTGKADEQESVVHIHIGRIDVRAAPQPAKLPTMRVAPEKPKMSLDEYLQGREDK
ncbi:MAG: hypothetical protein JEZ00_05340 [Anaerolineaceae bacterium]|nr:hypothetical protein [Anaerolineaceae bacterium]